MHENIGEPLRLPDGTVVPIIPAIKAGDFVYLSGQLGMDDDGNIIDEDVISQTRACVNRIRDILNKADADLENIIKATVWLTDASDFPAFNRIWKDTFNGSPPTRSTIVSELLLPGAKVEIEVVAYTGN